MRLSILLLLVMAAVPLRAFGQYEALSETAYQRFLSIYIGIINTDQFHAELEIVPSQIAEIKDRVTKAKSNALDIYSQAKAALAESKDRDICKQMCDDAYSDYVAEFETVLNDVLLAHQREQLDRCVLWTMIKSEMRFETSNRRPFKSVLQNDVVRELIDIDESQARELKEQADQLQAEYVKELAALQDKYEAKLRETLRPEQREKLEQLLGETPAFYFR